VGAATPWHFVISRSRIDFGIGFPGVPRKWVGFKSYPTTVELKFS